jgi:integrase/recombinase XerD
MLELYFKYPRVLRRLRDGGLGDEMDRIAAYLAEFGYKRALAKVYLSRLGRFRASCRVPVERCRLTRP